VASIAVRFDHIRLDVSDIGAAADFYQRALGLLPVIRYRVADRVILQLAPGGVPPGVELWQEEGLIPTPHPTQHVAFSVADVPGLVEHARALGYRVVEEPLRVGEETVAFLADPDGHLIELNDFRGRGTSEAGA
jgi:catechol 2,3-dioxygenase-like lactoylglutathione lyase family enzyme